MLRESQGGGLLAWVALLGRHRGGHRLGGCRSQVDPPDSWAPSPVDAVLPLWAIRLRSGLEVPGAYKQEGEEAEGEQVAVGLAGHSGHVGVRRVPIESESWGGRVG